jgi:predicted permease
VEIIIQKILPILLVFVLGYILKILRVLSLNDGDRLIQIIFHFSLPALVLTSISQIDISVELALLPLAAALVIMGIYGISFFTAKMLKLKQATFGTFLIGSMILNNGFLIPFILAAYDKAGLATLLLFDFANGFLAFTFIYYLAVKYGNQRGSKHTLIRKFLSSAPLWALVIALMINLLSLKIPHPVHSFLNIAGDTTIPLMMLSLGIFFSPKIHKIKLVFLGVFIRMGIGMGLGLLLTILFKLDGLNRIIVIIASAAPVGFNTLTFASLEKLDKDYAANLVSASILVGILLTPLLIFLLGNA